MRKLQFVLISSFLAILLIIAIPIIIISYALVPYNIIYYSKEYHSYQDPTTIEQLNIDVDIGNVEINYISYAIDFSVRIDIEFELSGIILEEASFSDFFETEWHDLGGVLNFSMHSKDGIKLEEITSKARIKNILVSLRANIKCDFNINVKSGGVLLDAPWGISLGNVFSNISHGYIQYDFSYCFIEGNITAISNLGDVNLNLIDVKYSKDAKMNLSNSNGVINFIISQKQTMGANVTGIATTEIGEINVIYEDDSSNTGAMLTFYNHTTGWIGIENSWSGFNDPLFLGEDGYLFSSFDFPAPNNYNLSFYKASDFGKYSVNLSST